MACWEGFVGFIWVPVQMTLESFLQNTAMAARIWFPNWFPVILLPRSSPGSIVSIQDILTNFREFLDDEDYTILGIYGMEGMEKTILLQNINDEFSGRSSGRFDHVIFVPVTRDVGVDFIQKEILGCLGLDTESSSPAILIFNALREKKFLLLLDNLWARLDLRAIGIPLSPYLRQGSKIAFTARSADVCSDMGASRWKLKMPLLSVDISMGWEVFSHDWGAERVLDEGVQDVLSKFCSFLDDDDSTIFGIYGMGGIGKTSLLRDMSNKFFRREPRRFELVIFIVVPTDISGYLVQKNIQMKILQRLGLDGESNDPKNAVSKALSPKKFLLLVDNLWVEVDFREIGIPFPPYSRKGSKIVFTTQSAQVCEETGAGRWKFKMPLLSRQSSKPRNEGKSVD